MKSRSVCVLVFLGSFGLLGQDVVEVASAGMVKVEYDDPQVRVLRFTESPGAKLPMHSHPAYVAVGLGNDVSRYTFPDGRSSKREDQGRATQYFLQSLGYAKSDLQPSFCSV
jgi:hypothetical protein